MCSQKWNLKAVRRPLASAQFYRLWHAKIYGGIAVYFTLCLQIMINVKSIAYALTTLVGVTTIGASSSTAAEMQEKSERFTEVGALTADGVNLINFSFVHRDENFYGYTSIGAPFLLNFGLGLSSMPDGSGLNFRIGLDTIGIFWNSSITYNFRLSESNSLEVGVGYLQTFQESGYLSGASSYPVLSFRHQW